MSSPDYLFGDGLPLHLAPSPPAAQPPPRLKIAVYGDSYTADRGGEGPRGWPQLVSDALGVETVNMAAIGSGYVRCFNGSTFPYAATVNPVPGAAAAVVAGTQNDRNEDPVAVARAAVVTYEVLRCANPNVRLLVVGAHWPWTATPSPNALAVQDGLRQVCEEQGIPFLDPIAGEWLTSTPGLIDSSGSHPNLAGQAVIAERIGPALDALLA